MIPTISITACVAAMTCSVLLAFGYVRSLLLLGIATHALYIALNILLCLREGQGAIALLLIPSLWAVGWNCFALHRLRKQHADFAETDA